MTHPRRSILALSFALATSTVVCAADPATRPTDDADVTLVRAAIVKMKPKLNAAEITPTKTIEALGGRDITVMEILGELAERIGTPIDDAAVNRATNATPSKTMRGLSVSDLATQTRGPAK